MTTPTPEELEQSFLAAEEKGGPPEGSVRRRILPSSKVDIFVEVRFPGLEWALVVRSREKLEDRDLMLTNGLTCRIREGSVEILADQQTDRLLFCSLLADLVGHLQLPSKMPTRTLVRRLNAWRRMLTRGLPTGLTPEARLGLFGELLVLQDLMLSALGTAAVRSWVGPRQSPQDFVLGSTAVEVKSVARKEMHSCRISNENQLDSDGLNSLFLVHQVVDQSPEGISLPELVDDLREDPLIGPELSWFENSLMEAGWLDSHRDNYLNDRYALVRRQCFTIETGFPRMTPVDLPVGVSGVSYFIDLSTCESHRVDEGKVRESLIGAGAAER
ncbi:PD-(D/E)XK motif protein [Actinomadura sp. ATCC 39365]